MQEQELKAQLMETLADPQARQSFFAEYDRIMQSQQNQQPQQPGYTMPGRSPMLVVPHGDTDIEFWMNRMNQIAAYGFPYDNQGKAVAMWEEIPQGFYRNAIDHLISRDYA